MILNGSTVMNTVFYSFEYFADSELVKNREENRKLKLPSASFLAECKHQVRKLRTGPMR